MTAFAQSYIRGNSQVSGLDSLYFKAYAPATGVADGAYHTPGRIQNGTLTLTELFTQDSYKRRKQYGYELKVEADLLYTNKTGLIKSLDVLASSDVDMVAKEISGKIWASENLSATTFGKFVGMDWELDASGDATKHRIVKLICTRFLFPSDIALMTTSTFPTASPAIGTDPGTDLLHSWDALTNADLWSAGLASMKIAVPSGGTLQDLGYIRNAKFMAKTISKADQAGRMKPQAIEITAEVEAHQASATELAALPNSIGTADSQFTFADGAVFATTAQQLGVSNSYNLAKDMEDSSFIKFSFAGYIVNTQASIWDGLWT